MQFKFKNRIEHKSDKNLLKRCKSVLAVLFFCGFDFRVFKFFNRFKILTIIYYIILMIITITATGYCCADPNFLQISSLIEYLLSVFILIVYDSKLTKFSYNLSKIDTYLRINFRDYYKAKKRLFFIIVVLWLTRFGYITIHCTCYGCFSNVFIYALSLFSPFALDLNRVWRFVLLDIIRHRLYLLRERLEEMPESNYYLYVSDNKTFKEDKIRFCIHLYRCIANTVDLIAPEIHASMFVSIICSLPKLIVNVYHILLVIEHREPVQSIGFLVMHIFQVCFLLFSPCIIVELHTIEVEKIRIYLIHRLIDEKDQKIKEDIEIFLQYTSIRSFQSKIWRYIPINASLPIEIANICTSSVIVAINFTHLFG